MRTSPTRFAFSSITGRSWLVLLSSLSLASHAVVAGTLDARTKQAILDCTFEVLAQAPMSESERRAARAVPLARVAGTAFCFGDGELATAAHVFEPVLGGRFETPVVRDREGHVYEVESIVRYSMSDDFVTFKVAGLPARAAQPHDTSDRIGEHLYLAWRQRDQQIVFASTQYRGRSTLSDFGREGWIEFGPSAGHGASGAALFNERGQVVGLINRTSSEDRDAIGYAVPIQKLEAASTDWADISSRDPMRVLGMPSERNEPLRGGIPLPAPYARFEKHMVAVRQTYFAHMLPYSLSLRGDDAPLSDAQRADLCTALMPEYCSAQASTAAVRTVQDRQGCEIAWRGVGATLVRCEGPDALASADKREPQPPALNEPSVHTPPSCSSDDGFYAAASLDSFPDHTGARWEVRAWPARGCDWVVISISRTTPSGTLTFVRGTTSAYADEALMQLKVLTSIRRDGDKPGGEAKDPVLAEVGGTRVETAR